MLSAAAIHGIDLSMMWGTVDRHPNGRIARIREVCLAVPSSGKTAIILLGEPFGPDLGHAERVSCIQAACGYLGVLPDNQVRLAQTLPEPRQTWAVQAFADAGFMKVGDLAYMRRGVEPPDHPAKQDWPEGITVRNVRGIGPNDEDHKLVIEALDRSYLETLDCPELCGIRDTADVLESHRCTGDWHPRLWWLVFKHGQPHGCVLFNRVPEQDSVELVYLGLSPEIRGQGLGLKLMELGLENAVRTDATQVTCAVDLRNIPARKLYAKLGFNEFGRRVAMVCRVTRA